MSPLTYLQSCGGTLIPGLEFTTKPRGLKPVDFHEVGESFRKQRREALVLPEPPKPQLRLNAHLKELQLSVDAAVKNNSSSNDGDESYFDSFPAGYRFCPTDQELIVDYLKKKVMKEELPRHKFKHVNIYKYSPEELAAMFSGNREKEFYFFTPRDKKYPKGSRPNRAAGGGYWKATGADRKIKFNGKEVGSKKSLVFYRGKPPHGNKTNWIMQEYRVNDPPPSKRHENDMRLDEWVLCKIYKKVEKSLKEKAKEKPTTSFHHENRDSAKETIESDTEDHQNTPRFNAGAEDYQAWEPSRFNAGVHEYYQALQPLRFVAGAEYCQALKPSGFDAAGAETEEFHQALNSSYWTSMGMDMEIGEPPLCTQESNNYLTYEEDILEDIFLGEYENSQPLIE